MVNFWQKLKKPILALAPMAGVTDSSFRRICREYGADVLYSEMASVNALVYSPEKTLEMLKFHKKERPYVVQLFGSNPKHFEKATKIITNKVKPDGIDINFGCPVPKIAKQKAGAELFKDISLSKKVIEAVLSSTDLPVSIKTRVKAGNVTLDDFLNNITDLDVKALMIHGRTLKQGFSGEISIKSIKSARKYFKGIILANGGVNNIEEARKVIKNSGADGIGLARSVMGNPWLFSDIKNDKKNIILKDDMKKTILTHLDYMISEKGDRGIIEFRKHLCWYVSGMDGAKKLREKFVKVDSRDEIIKIFKEMFL